MSKSKGNVIDPVPLIDHFGLDAIRYYLLREVPFGADGVFTPEAFVERVNYDLANDLGNLLNRTVAMINKYFDGSMPAYIKSATPFDQELVDLIDATAAKVENAMEEMEFSIALTAIWQLVSRTNKYIDETQPWMLAKDEEKQEQLGSVMYHLGESLRIISVFLRPFLTRTPEKIWEQLGISEEQAQWESIRTFGIIEAGTKVSKGTPVFPRLDVEKEVEYIVELMGGKADPEPEEIEDENQITIDDFSKVELKVAEVIGAEPVEGADRLLKIQLDLGSEKRQVVSGIAKYYSPEELKGKKKSFVSRI